MFKGEREREKARPDENGSSWQCWESRGNKGAGGGGEWEVERSGRRPPLPAGATEQGEVYLT